MLDDTINIDALLALESYAAPGPATSSPECLGPRAISAQYGHIHGVDRDFGTRWGERGNQRISWLAPLDASRGLLYAYDRDRFHCFGCNAPGESSTSSAGSKVSGSARLWHASTATSRLRDTQAGAGGSPAVRPAGHWSAPRAGAGPSRAFRVYGAELRLRHRRHRLGVPLRHGPPRVRCQLPASRRGIDVRGLEGPLGEPAVGHTGQHWARMTRHLLTRGVSGGELIAMELSRRGTTCQLTDSFHGRLVVPVRSPSGQVAGFVGRSNLQDPRAHVPAPHPHGDLRQVHCPVLPHARGGHSGAPDALAVTAAAATSGRLAQFWPCTTNGVSVSTA